MGSKLNFERIENQDQLAHAYVRLNTLENKKCRDPEETEELILLKEMIKAYEGLE
jgi:hypothetical protein